jgi:DNA replication protein DnaC
MDKMHQMRLSVMARAYREQEEAPGISEMGFDERLAMIVDAEWDARRNIIITGASGAGKTWISNALGVAACNAFYTARYTRLPELLDELTVFKDEEWLKQRKKYIKCDLLIIDDWLLEKIKPNEAREIMEVIEARDRTGSLILCSQFAPSAWHAKLGNGAIADAVIDRVVYKSYTIHIEGDESMRKRMGGIS